MKPEDDDKEYTLYKVTYHWGMTHRDVYLVRSKMDLTRVNDEDLAAELNIDDFDQESGDELEVNAVTYIPII